MRPILLNLLFLVLARMLMARGGSTGLILAALLAAAWVVSRIVVSVRGGSLRAWRRGADPRAVPLSRARRVRPALPGLRPGVFRPPELELSAAQVDLLRQARRDWEAVVLRPRPTNREQVEQALQEAYEAAGLRPVPVSWCESPDELIERQSLWPTTRETSVEVLKRAIWFFYPDLMPPLSSECELDPYMGEPWLRNTATGRRIRQELGAFPTDWHALDAAWESAPRRQPRGSVDGHRAFPAQALVPRVATAEFVSQLTGLDLGPWRALGTLAREGGGYVLSSEIALACERHSATELDAEGRLHSEEGAAIEWANGFAVHAWHGVAVPHELFERRRLIGMRDVLAEQNQELRRVMIEMIGYERLVETDDASLVDEDDYGRLWRVDVPEDEAVTFVEVLNATPEPDGSRCRYFLRVPPGLAYARAAVAWTFGLETHAWSPSAES